MTITVSESELKQVLQKLDSVHLELLRFRAMLLPEEDGTREEREEIEKARKELEKGSKISLENLIKS